MSAQTDTVKQPGPPVGIFSDVSNEDYHRGVGVSKSDLDKIARSPLHYITEKRNPRPPTPQMFFGSAFHAIVLEPELFAETYVPDPAPGSYSKDAKAARFELEAAGKIVIGSKTDDDKGIWGASDWDKLHRMRDAVLAHPIASVLLDPDQGPVEQSVYWIDPETRKLCKCRPDKWNDAHRVLVDLKSTMDASYTGFGKACANYRYNVQAAYYLDGWFRASDRPLGGTARAFVFAAVEKEPPYAVACYRLDAEEIEAGREMYRRDLDLYAQCHAENQWPGYDESIRVLRMPPWGLRADIS